MHLASIQRASSQGLTSVTPRQRGPPTCSCHPPWDQGGLPQVEPLQTGVPTFLAALVLAGSPSSFGKGQAGGSHGGTLSLRPLPRPGGLCWDWDTLPPPAASHHCPCYPTITERLCNDRPLPLHLLLPCHPLSPQLRAMESSLSPSRPWVMGGGRAAGWVGAKGAAGTADGSGKCLGR